MLVRQFKNVLEANILIHPFLDVFACLDSSGMVGAASNAAKEKYGM